MTTDVILAVLGSGIVATIASFVIDKRRQKMEARESDYNFAKSIRDELREENLTLKSEVNQLKRRVWKLELKLSQLDPESVPLDE